MQALWLLRMYALTAMPSFNFLLLRRTKSVFRLVHVLPPSQLSRPSGQQRPWEQCEPAWQLKPQAPHEELEDLRSTQVSLHRVSWPAGQGCATHRTAVAPQ